MVGPSSAGHELSPQDVRRVAHLARLAIDDAGVERAQRELAAVLGYIERLRELDLSNTSPMAHPTDATNRWDEDEPREGLTTEALMKLVPPDAAAAPFIRVPRVLGEGGGA